MNAARSFAAVSVPIAGRVGRSRLRPSRRRVVVVVAQEAVLADSRFTTITGEVLG